MKIVYALAGVALLVILLGGCGGSGDGTNAAAVQTETTTSQEKPEVPEIFRDREPLKCPSRKEIISVTLDADPDPENVGLVMAQTEGFFTDAGLEVSVNGPKNPARAVKYVALGIDDIGVAQQPQVVLAQEEGGAPLVAVGSVLRQSNAALIWLPDSGIRDVSDLEGKTIAIPGVPFQEKFLEEVLGRAGLSLDDVEIKHSNFKSVPALLEGRADAIFGGTWNIEGAALKAEGAKPVIKRAQSLGLPGYEELVVVAPEKCVAKRPGIIADFMAVVARGTEAALKHPGKAAKLVAQNYELDPDFRMRDLRAQFEATLPMLSGNARMDPAKAAHLSSWMEGKGMVEESRPVSRWVTNEFLPAP